MARLQPLVGERQRGETSKAVQACNDYLRTGPGRTIAGLWRRYVETARTLQREPPSKIHNTLKKWSARYGWLARAETYDATLEAEKNARAEAMARLASLAGERQRGETSRSVQACNDFLRMGPGRTVAGLWRRYVAVSEGEERLVPSRVKGTLTNWSARYGWLARAELYDAALEAEKNARAEAAMQSGLALEHERVEALKALAAYLTDQVEEETPEGTRHRVWLPDVKQIGRGMDAERVDIERFNAALFSELRGVLDDLAKETGGRIKKAEIAGKDGGDIIIRVGGGIVDEL